VTRDGRHVRLAVRAADPDGRPQFARVSFGDGVSEQRRLRPHGRHGGLVGFGHRFRADRRYTVTVGASGPTRSLCGQVELSARRRVPIRVS
jgi:hypothetical protein